MLDILLCLPQESVEKNKWIQQKPLHSWICSKQNHAKQNCKTARQHPKNRCVNKLMTKIEKKEPFPAGSKTWPPTPMSNLFNLRAGNKLRLKAKINWLGWRINNYYHKNAQKNKKLKKRKLILKCHQCLT